MKKPLEPIFACLIILHCRSFQGFRPVKTLRGSFHRSHGAQTRPLDPTQAIMRLALVVPLWCTYGIHPRCSVPYHVSRGNLNLFSPFPHFRHRHGQRWWAKSISGHRRDSTDYCTQQTADA